MSLAIDRIEFLRVGLLAASARSLLDSSPDMN
jgi:hypothetical protein